MHRRHVTSLGTPHRTAAVLRILIFLTGYTVSVLAFRSTPVEGHRLVLVALTWLCFIVDYLA